MTQSKNYNLVLILPKAFDFIASVVVEGFDGHNVSYCATAESNGASYANPSLAKQLIQSGIPAVLCSGMGVDIEICQLAMANGGLVVVDGADHADFIDIQRLGINPSKCKAIFKREYLKGWSRASKPNVLPFPMAITRDCLTGPQEKKLLLTMLCNLRTNPIRAAVANWLTLNVKDPRVVVGSTSECSYDAWKPQPNRIDTPKYQNLLATSLASINLPGAGFDCKRYWEIVGASSLIVSQELEIEIPNDFVSGKEKLEFRSTSELSGIINFLTLNPGGAVEMINRASERANKFHTCERRVEPLLECAFKK